MFHLPHTPPMVGSVSLSHSLSHLLSFSEGKAHFFEAQRIDNTLMHFPASYLDRNVNSRFTVLNIWMMGGTLLIVSEPAVPKLN